MFTVIWRNTAMDELADLFVQTNLDDQNLIEQRVLRLNARLALDPFEVGESRWDDFRVAFNLPMGMLYEVDVLNRVVYVVNCWLV